MFNFQKKCSTLNTSRYAKSENYVKNYGILDNSYQPVGYNLLKVGLNIQSNKKEIKFYKNPIFALKDKYVAKFA